MNRALRHHRSQSQRGCTSIALGRESTEVVTLPPPVADATPRKEADMSGALSPAQPVGPGPVLLEEHLSLAAAEELVVRNTTTERLERLQIAWDTPERGTEP